MSGTASEATSDPGQVPNQLAILVPIFDPSVDNMEIWTNKVELLLLTWASNKILELATRLVLGYKGTAFQKLQLHRSEVLVNDAKGIQKIVELVGGKWGAVLLEKKFDIKEKTLYRGLQKSDEFSDLYLFRNDVIWTELISKKIDLSEIQAYILLRGSRLGSDDKKRVLVDSGAEKGGKLNVKNVEAAVRMIGSGFFQDMLGNKRDKGFKTYDHTIFTMGDTNKNNWETDRWGLLDRGNFFRWRYLRSDGRRWWWRCSTSTTVWRCSIRDDLERYWAVCTYYSSYQDARKRLSEKVRFRGFWSVKKGEKDFGKKGKMKGKGKSSLANRIANSYCRLCLKKGHWKNECPSRDQGGGSMSAASTVPTSFVTAMEVSPEIASLPVIEDHDISKHMVDCFVSQVLQVFDHILGKR